MLLAEWALLILISYFSFKHRKYYCMILSILQTGLITYLEVTGQTESHIAHLYVDKLTLVMCLIVGLIGGILGGWLVSLFGWVPTGTWGTFLSSIIGAIVLLWIVSLFTRHKPAKTM